MCALQLTFSYHISTSSPRRVIILLSKCDWKQATFTLPLNPPHGINPLVHSQATKQVSALPQANGGKIGGGKKENMAASNPTLTPPALSRPL
jgi:hypothetical protein